MLAKSLQQWAWKSVHVNASRHLVKTSGHWPDPDRSLTVKEVADAVADYMESDNHGVYVHVYALKHGPGW